MRFASTNLHGPVKLLSHLLMPSVVGPLALSWPSQPHRWQQLLISFQLDRGLEGRRAASSLQPCGDRGFQLS